MFCVYQFSLSELRGYENSTWCKAGLDNTDNIKVEEMFLQCKLYCLLQQWSHKSLLWRATEPSLYRAGDPICDHIYIHNRKLNILFHRAQIGEHGPTIILVNRISVEDYNHHYISNIQHSHTPPPHLCWYLRVQGHQLRVLHHDRVSGC